MISSPSNTVYCHGREKRVRVRDTTCTRARNRQTLTNNGRNVHVSAGEQLLIKKAFRETLETATDGQRGCDTSRVTRYPTRRRSRVAMAVDEVRGDHTHTHTHTHMGGEKRVITPCTYILFFFASCVRKNTRVACVFLMKSYDGDDNDSLRGPRRGSQGFDKKIFTYIRTGRVQRQHR
jgi:hypothetical protein